MTDDKWAHVPANEMTLPWERNRPKGCPEVVSCDACPYCIDCPHYNACPYCGNHEGLTDMTDGEWSCISDDRQYVEFRRLCATVKPCSCGKEAVVWNTLMHPLFCNWFSVWCIDDDCERGRGDKPITAGRQHGHSGLVAVIKEWNDDL